MDVTTWYLEQTSHSDLIAAKSPSMEVDIVRAEVPSPEFGRFLYTAVGGDWSWTERLPWTWREWADWLDGVETWVAYHRGTPAGYVELALQEDATVEITYFGLLPWATGKGVGGHLLEVGTARAWDIAERRPEREPTRRVWLHTCSLDGPAALANYRARGFRVYDTRLNVPGDEYEGDPPGPWPGAGPRTRGGSGAVDSE
ncbi:ribosomal protein S18 acetylase RimI-like enzyme [Streptosporangium becharense]|uniref:Ribosomal protein S18 acetylase RimI-like enzyme n=1 Tax=Streptosporangium becharense TaxID=1816182 RepID=A0A7W9IK31_9ACTN|nr:GNAT family N-acetyltransferase [Streptosporangium becharense]MBB2913216.1 ribosomal protein S18 acetylase RimI-like enzyme [Streptosporangium becharense]MBB5822199.1 ribosomal protein S18 acetylase RimI-like enzyme [Streptosporangium becharense]